MKIAVISDIHDQSDHLQWFSQEIKKYNVSHIFALGDYCSPFIVEKLASIPIPIFAVWGNNDSEKDAMINAAQVNQKFTFAPHKFGEIIIDERQYFLTHYPDLAENAAKSHEFDAVFHGHTHYARCEKIGIVPIINPGKFALYPHNVTSFAIFDTDTQKHISIIRP